MSTKSTDQKRPIIDRPNLGIDRFPEVLRISNQYGHVAQVKSTVADAGKRLRAMMQDKAIMAEFPPEDQSAMESAAQAISAAVGHLESIAPETAPAARDKDLPTRQQGQFLAFIREYIMRNESGVAPSHANLQRFFNLTAPSVNSMLIRLEARGFIRRVPGMARAIELTIHPDWIPQLDRPFKF